MKRNLAIFLFTVTSTLPNAITPDNIIPKPQQFAYIEDPSFGQTTIPLPFPKPDVPQRYEKKVDMNLIQRINNEINSNYRYVRDEINFPNELDYWQTYDEFKERGSGDCDDFAIAKYHEIKEKYPHLDTYLVIGSWINPKNENEKSIGHMVTAIHYENQWWLLDNINKEVLRDIQREDFKPSLIMNESEIYIVRKEESGWEIGSKIVNSKYLTNTERVLKL